MKMYFLVYHVKPLPDLVNSSSLAGAYVSCWIKSDSIKKARNTAENEIERARWEIIKIDTFYEITEGDYATDSESYQLYRQALVDKWVLRFHTYSHN